MLRPTPLGPHPRIVFFGSGAFAIPSFEALLDAGYGMLALVTQPDREKGRGRTTSPPALKPVAERRGVPLLQPRRIKEPAALDALQDLAPDLSVVVAYGQILPRSILELPPHGNINVHGSLLPRYRGAAPIQWAVVNGENETGVTTMLLDEGMDTGPVLLQRTTRIGSAETAGELEPRLAELGAALLLETLERLRQGTLTPTPQEASAATLAPILKKQDGQIDWSTPAEALSRRVRGFSPWPGTFTAWSGAALKLLRATPAEGSTDAGAGEVVRVDGGGVAVACGGGTLLRLLEVQPESRKAMGAAAWAIGARLAAGARLG